MCLFGFLTAQYHSALHPDENEPKHLHVCIMVLGNRWVHILSNFVKSGKILKSDTVVSSKQPFTKTLLDSCFTHGLPHYTYCSNSIIP